jgi:flagellar hook protein FlgE
MEAQMIWGAFNNASLAMQTMDVAMGGISQNIANVNTTGYKRTDTLFKTVMSESMASPGTLQNSPTTATATTGLNIFGVMPVSRNLITAQGTVAATNTWTDMAINGRGFFILGEPDTTGLPQTTVSTANELFTRAGNFTQKAVGTKSYFTNGAGQYLLGWMADAQGRIPGVATTASSPVAGSSSTTTTGTATLQPIYTQPGQTITGVATTAMQGVLNLPSGASMTSSPQTFSSTVVDDTGANVGLTETWTRTGGDTWSVDFTLDSTSASGSTGAITGTPVTVTMDNFGNVVSPNTSASGTGFQDLIIDWTNGAVTTTTTASIDLTSSKPTFNEISTELTVYDNAYNAETLPISFEHTASGQWYMRVKPASANGTANSISGGGATGGYSVPVTFDGSGRLVSPTSVDFTVSWTPQVAETTPATVPIPSVLSSYASQLQSAVQSVTVPALPATAAQLATYQTSLDAAIGAITVTAPATATDLSTYSTAVGQALSDASAATATARANAATAAGTNTVSFDISKCTQYAGETSTSIFTKSLDQDGYESGVMDSCEFTNTGELIGHFSNGHTRTLAMVPVATFVSADQLDPISGTVFRATQQAGDMSIGSIASQGSGSEIVASAVETSNVDLANEFSNMIITQKAYSMNATVFKTADEMMTTARDLYR